MTNSRRAVYVLADVSGSMQGTSRQSREVAWHHIKRGIDAHADGAAPSLVLLTYGVEVELDVSPDRLPETEEAVDRSRLGQALERLAELLEADKGSDTVDVASASAFLLSDGFPTDAWTDGLARLRSGEPGEQLPIHAIGCGPDVNWDVLEEVADPGSVQSADQLTVESVIGAVS